MRCPAVPDILLISRRKFVVSLSGLSSLSSPDFLPGRPTTSHHHRAALFSSRVILMLSAVRGPSLHLLPPSRGSECMNIKSSLKIAQNLPEILSPVHDPNLPLHAGRTGKSKEHGGMVSVVCLQYLYTYLMWVCGHFLDKPCYGQSTVNTPPGQIGLNQNNCSMLLIILEFHVWSGLLSLKTLGQLGGMAGAILPIILFNFIWFPLLLIILRHILNLNINFVICS